MTTNRVQIFVRLLDEGTVVYRPTMGEEMGAGVFRLLATSDYDSEDEVWEFTPGTVVTCTSKTLGGKSVLVASEAVAM